MKAKNTRRLFLLAWMAAGGAAPAFADQVISDDLVVNGGSACVGSECVDGETFGFDTVRIKGPEPRLQLLDTSSSASFPTADWTIGITDDGMGGPSELFIDHDDSGTRVLRLTVDGAVALGAGAELVPGAVSVGAMGNERRIVHVADGVDDTDAVNVGQFQAFQDDVTNSLGADADAFDQRLADIQSRIDSLTDRVDALAAEVQ